MAGLPETVGTQALADLIGIGPRRIQQLEGEGVLIKNGRGKYPLAENVQRYIRWKSASEVEKVTPDASDDALQIERTRKLRLENDEAERLLVKSEDALAALDAIVGPLIADLSAVPPRVTDDVILRRRIEDEMNEVLGAVSGRLRKAGADLQEGRDALDTGAEDDTGAMGEEE